MISGYYTALERTLFLDKIDDASLKAWEANIKVHKRGLELIKPGAKCSDICHELNELFAELGYLQYRTFGYGHSFGVLVSFLWKRVRIRITRRYRYNFRRKYGYFNGANDNDTRRKTRSGRL